MDELFRPTTDWIQRMGTGKYADTARPVSIDVSSGNPQVSYGTPVSEFDALVNAGFGQTVAEDTARKQAVQPEKASAPLEGGKSKKPIELDWEDIDADESMQSAAQAYIRKYLEKNNPELAGYRFNTESRWTKLSKSDPEFRAGFLPFLKAWKQDQRADAVKEAAAKRPDAMKRLIAFATYPATKSYLAQALASKFQFAKDPAKAAEIVEEIAAGKEDALNIVGAHADEMMASVTNAKLTEADNPAPAAPRRAPAHGFFYQDKTGNVNYWDPALQTGVGGQIRLNAADAWEASKANQADLQKAFYANRNAARWTRHVDDQANINPEMYASLAATNQLIGTPDSRFGRTVPMNIGEFLAPSPAMEALPPDPAQAARERARNNLIQSGQGDLFPNEAAFEAAVTSGATQPGVPAQAAGPSAMAKSLSEAVLSTRKQQATQAANARAGVRATQSRRDAQAIRSGLVTAPSPRELVARYAPGSTFRAQAPAQIPPPANPVYRAGTPQATMGQRIHNQLEAEHRTKLATAQARSPANQVEIAKAEARKRIAAQEANMPNSLRQAAKPEWTKNAPRPSAQDNVKAATGIASDASVGIDSADAPQYTMPPTMNPSRRAKKYIG